MLDHSKGDLMNKKDAKLVMMPHSIAKVQLYIKYLSVYLNIIERVQFIDKIYLFDLFAGEGIYEDGNKGSSIQSIEAINRHYCANNNRTKDISLILNDTGYSKIEKHKKKIDRIKDYLSEAFVPPNVIIKYFSIDYSSIVNHLIRHLDSMDTNNRALVFIDPWGYKDIHPEEIKHILKNGKTELLLFLPVYFMYRFANKVVANGFEGGESLEKFLTELFNNNIPNTKNVHSFIIDIKTRFQEYLNMKYIDTFFIQRDKNSVFCLFFFTHNKIGYQRMVQTKWNIDKEQGKGFNDNKIEHLFSEAESTGFKDRLEQYILSGDGRTNNEITEFSYENGFLPKHAGEIIKKLKSDGLIDIIALDSKELKGLYLDNEKRNILFKKIKD
jgi:three-Cys-motif partner protein